MTEHQPMPVHGYTPQSDARLVAVNANKEMEERLLRVIEKMFSTSLDIDGRWLSIARTHFEEGFMALNRAIFQPKRVRLPEDAPLSPELRQEWERPAPPGSLAPTQQESPR